MNTLLDRSRFYLTVRTLPSRFIGLEVHGEVVRARAIHLQSALAELLADGHRHLAISLADVPGIDSDCIQVMLRTLLATERRGGSLVLAGANRHVRRVLDTTGASRVMGLIDSLDDLQDEPDAEGEWAPG